MKADPMRDPALDSLKASVSCAVILERLGAGWRLDRHESSRNALKYRRGPGEIIIISHAGHGWWNPHNTDKGDCFDLVQQINPGLSFGKARHLLEGLAGLAPSLASIERRSAKGADARPVLKRWLDRPRLRRGSPAWCYLTDVRALPPAVLLEAVSQDAVREGRRGSAWFGHRDHLHALTHVEARGPEFRGALRGGTKTLFRLKGAGSMTRLAICEAPIDALSLAAFEDIRADTLYAATGGGIGPGTTEALKLLLAELAQPSSGCLIAATDHNPAGERYVAILGELAASAGVTVERLRPAGGLEDWNDVLKAEQAGRRENMMKAAA